jgi:response regulator RpfG family c-di-GMP phosphodiesterase
MNVKILCVDDDSNVLEGFQRNLRKRFQVDTALSGEQALRLIDPSAPYAVIVSDMKMPAMDGVQLLQKVQAKSPETVRIMLTGNADQQTAIAAVNQGHIFQFLNKPCAPETLIQAIENGVRQFHLLRAEKDLLENTLKGSIKVLTEVLSLIEPHAFGRGQTLQDYMRSFAEFLGIPFTWELELAALLSQIGYLTIPPELMLKQRQGLSLVGAERDLFARLPEIGSNLLSHIPRLESIARIVLYHHKNFDGTGFPADSVAGEDIPIGARILKVLSDLHDLESTGLPKFKALQSMQKQAGLYDPRVMDAAFACFDVYLQQSALAAAPARQIAFKELQPGHTLSRDVKTTDGTLILTTGTKISPAMLEKLRNFAHLSGIHEPLYIEA